MSKFEFLIRPSENMRICEDFMLFYVLQGSSEFTIENQKYRMDKDDFLVVNVDERFAFSSKGSFLAASFTISYSELSGMLKRNMIYFKCNTVVEDNEICNEIRAYINQIVSEQSQEEPNDIYLNSLYYSILNILTQDFLVKMDEGREPNEEHKFDDRKRAITEYIRSNYNKDISLNELAGNLYLSNAYLSKYIKRQFGMSFLEYVNSVRLNYAVSHLLHSDNSLVHIAMETGFASSAAFNKAFREKYGVTPSVYRKEWKNKSEVGGVKPEEDKIIRERVDRLIQAGESEQKRKARMYDRQVILKNKTNHKIPQTWNQMINIGSASDLLLADVQRQVLLLKDVLHFKYIRFWDIYAPEMLLDPHSDNYNFTKLDAVLDFLVNNGLKPYIELRIKPKKLVRNVQETVIYRKKTAELDDPVALEHFMSALIIHMMNRFSTAEVESWFFEIWKTEREEYLGVTEIEDLNESIPLYLDRFELIANVLRRYLPNIQIGGGGFSLRYGAEAFREILIQWQKREQLPNFVSVYCYPYTIDSVALKRNQSMNQEYLKDTVLEVRRLMDETEFPVSTLHVSEWNFSVSNRNVLNDHCMKGAYILKNICDTLEYVDLIGYWVASDIFSEYYDSIKLLNGAGGLMTKFGMPKPAYFAYQFMEEMGRYLQKKGDNYIITNNGNDNYRIACYNLKRLSYQYGLMLEDQIRLDQQESLFEDLKPLMLDFELPVSKDGTYKLQIKRINRKHGSVQDEWMQMGSPIHLSYSDIEYLHRITVPQMRIREVDSINRKIKFKVKLEPNEIMYIHAIYIYEEYKDKQ